MSASAARTRAIAGAVPRRAAASCLASAGVSRPRTATIWPPDADSASTAALSAVPRDGLMIASVSSSVSRNVPCRGISPESVSSRASTPSPDRCTPIEAAAETASSNVSVVA